MRTRGSVLAVAVAAVAMVVAPAAAQANVGGALPLPGFGAIVVDQAHKHVFVSGGPTGNSIVVTDFSGEVVKQITGEFGATGLVLSKDGATLYAALAAGDAVAAIDTVKFTETARYPTPAQTCPATLARTGQYVWIGYGCDGDWSGGVGRLDTAAATPAITLGQQGNAVFDGAPLVAAAENGPVVAAQPDLSLSATDVYTVNAGTLQAGASGTVTGSDVQDVTVTPDGATLYTAAGSEDHVAGLATADLSGRGAYATGHFPDAVEVSADGGYVATGAFTAAHKVLVFKSGGTTPVRAVGLDNSNAASGGLAWSTDNKRLFVVTQQNSGGAPGLSVVLDPTQGCTILC
jgi:hypothetical protein